MALSERPSLRLLPGGLPTPGNLQLVSADGDRADSEREEERRLVAAFLETRRRRCAPSTCQQDRVVLHAHFLPWLRTQRLLLWEVTPEVVERWTDVLVHSVERSTARAYVEHLRAFYEWLIGRRADDLRERHGVVLRNPVDRFNRVRREPEEEDFLPAPDEGVVRTFLGHRAACIEHAPSDARWLQACRDYLLWMVMNWAGLRRAEAVALARDDIDLAGLPHHHGSAIRVVDGKGHKGRVVDIQPPLLKKLAWYLQEVRPQAPGGWTATALLFPSQRRGMLDPDTLNYLLGRQQAEAGLAEGDRFACHGFRRAYATRLYIQLRAGRHPDPLAYIQGQLGHVYPSTTVRYCQLPAEYAAALRAEAARAIGRHYAALPDDEEGRELDD